MKSNNEDQGPPVEDPSLPSLTVEGEETGQDHQSDYEPDHHLLDQVAHVTDLREGGSTEDILLHLTSQYREEDAKSHQAEGDHEHLGKHYAEGGHEYREGANLVADQAAWPRQAEPSQADSSDVLVGSQAHQGKLQHDGKGRQLYRAELCQVVQEL